MKRENRLVSLVYLVYLVECDKPDEQNKPDEPDQPISPVPRDSLGSPALGHDFERVTVSVQRLVEALREAEVTCREIVATHPIRNE